MHKILLTLILMAQACSLILAPAPAQARPLLVISTENPGEHVQTRIVQRFVERVRACCADRIDVEHHFGAQLLRDRDVLAALSQGTVGMAFPGTWQLDRYVPDVGVFMMPVLYGRSEQDAARIQDSPLVEALSQQIEEALGVVVLGRWVALGHSNLFSKSKPLNDVADLHGLRIRSPGGLANEWRLSKLGATPVTVAWSDLLHALDENSLDGLLTTFATLGSANLRSWGIRYVLEDRQYFSFYVPLVSAYVWRSLDDATRRDLAAAWEAGVNEGRAAMRHAQEEARARAVEAGIVIVTPGPARIDAVRTRLNHAQSEIASRIGVDASILAGVSASFNEDEP
jgi:TRAP-type C4-dicarboxylate transport system, periplasmic component